MNIDLNIIMPSKYLYYGNIEVDIKDDELTELLQDIEKYKSAYIIYYNNGSKFAFTEKSTQEINQYLSENYQLVPLNTFKSLYKRK